MQQLAHNYVQIFQFIVQNNSILDKRRCLLKHMHFQVSHVGCVFRLTKQLKWWPIMNEQCRKKKSYMGYSKLSFGDQQIDSKENKGPEWFILIRINATHCGYPGPFTQSRKFCFCRTFTSCDELNELQAPLVDTETWENTDILGCKPNSMPSCKMKCGPALEEEKLWKGRQQMKPSRRPQKGSIGSFISCCHYKHHIQGSMRSFHLLWMDLVTWSGMLYLHDTGNWLKL